MESDKKFTGGLIKVALQITFCPISQKKVILTPFEFYCSIYLIFIGFVYCNLGLY